jgi:pimeloyl-ACP methyl ester carboxylesterase
VASDSPSSRTVTRDGVKLVVRDFGGRGRGLVLLHGLASTSHIFDLVAPKLTDEFRVVAYDQRGHGESSKPTSRFGFEHMAADAAAVIRELGLQRPVVLGHSWGANVALELGVREPDLVSGVILLDGGFLSMQGRMDWKTTKEMLAPPPITGMLIDDYLSMIRQFMSAELEVTPQVEAVFRSLMRVDRKGRIRPRLSRANHLKILRAMWEQDPVELLKRVRVPTLAVATRRETTEDSERMFIAAKEAAAEQVRAIDENVRFEWIEGIHDVPLQRPDAVADLIRRFAANYPGMDGGGGGGVGAVGTDSPSSQL